MISSVRTFWRRVSDGIEIRQLWTQFHADARASSDLYSKEIGWTRVQGESRWKRFRRLARGLFWAVILKVSPGRRVLLLVALLLIFQNPSLAAAALLVLLALELADRVMMKRDLEIAREIQSWLMPATPPVVPGVDIAFATRPANTVAGDYYDAFFRTGAGRFGPQSQGAEGDERLLLVVADVAGKSVPAAILMATLQASLRTLAALPGSLLELVRSLNQYACAQNLGGRFTTAFLAELDPATGGVTYVNAGHNWPVLRRASGVIERLEAGGLPLGIRPQAPYECGTTNLAAGDLLLIFTDGLVEAEDDKMQEYGEARMLSIVHGLGDGSASEVLRRLMASVDEFVGIARRNDDITCLVLRTSVPVAVNASSEKTTDAQ